MPESVHVIVSGIKTGLTYVVPYSHTAHLQHYLRNGIRTDDPVIYEVPKYQVRIEGGSKYEAVRFGVQNRSAVPPKFLICDAGLSQGLVCTPSWVPSYSPHSFARSARVGAWRLLTGRGFLIHEGADTTQGFVGGSLGCIEILDGQWNRFLAEIERLGKGTCAEIGAASKFKVTVQSAGFPEAKLVEPNMGR